MKNIKSTKKSKWLKLALISTAGITTLSAVPAMVCAKNITISNSTKATSEDPILKAASYVQITFNLSQADIAGGATITGKTVVKVKKGNPFGTVVKPTASKFGWTFKYWQYETPQGSKIEMKENTPCDNTGNVTAVFEQDKGNVVVEGKEIVSLTDTATYTASILPSTAPQDVDWYVTDSLDNPYAGSSKAEINKVDNKGVLKAGRITTGSDQPVYVFAVPENTTPTITAGSPNIKEVKLVSPWEHPDYDEYVITENDSGDYFCVEQTEFTDAEGNLSGIPLGGTDPVDLGLKTEFNDKIYIGNEITNIDNNFLADFTSFDNVIRLNNVVQIGSNFLSGATSYTIDLDLSNKVTYVGDCFMEGCTSFNGFVTFGDKIAHIGDNFMEGCSAFAQTLTLPESLTEIGNNFLYECNNFSTIEINCPISSFEGSDGSFAGTTEHTISVLCDGKATFDSLITLFPNKTGYIKRNLVEEQAYNIYGRNIQLSIDTISGQAAPTVCRFQAGEYFVFDNMGYKKAANSFAFGQADGCAKALIGIQPNDTPYISIYKTPTILDPDEVRWTIATTPVDPTTLSAERQALLNEDGHLEIIATLEGGKTVKKTLEVKKPISVTWLHNTNTYSNFQFFQTENADGTITVHFTDFTLPFGLTCTTHPVTDFDFSGWESSDDGWLSMARRKGMLTFTKTSAGVLQIQNSTIPVTLSVEETNTWKSMFENEDGTPKPDTEYAYGEAFVGISEADTGVADPFSYVTQQGEAIRYTFTANKIG